MAKADLRGASLEGANLSNVDIAGAVLAGANIKSAIFTGVDVSVMQNLGMDLSEAITDENVGVPVSDLSSPLPKLLESHRDWLKSKGDSGQQLDLSNVDLRLLGSLKMEHLTAIKALETKFFGMNLYKVQLQSAVLDGSDFRNCDLEDADLRGSSFKDTNFSHAVLKGANCAALMLGAGGTQRFNPCDFSGARLKYIDFSGAQLKDAIFTGADLSYADLSEADLRGADFTGAVMDFTNFDKAQTEGAKFDRDESRPVFQLPKDQE